MVYQDLPAGEIARRLALAQETPMEDAYLSAFLSDAPRPAAVLVPLLRAAISPETGERWHLLLTRRSDNLTKHRGQVAFPGGSSDPGDLTPEATALREAYEEIGLPPAAVTTLGQLNPMLTITNFHVTPVVGVIPWPHASAALPRRGQPHFHHPAGMAGRSNPPRDSPALCAAGLCPRVGF